LITVTMATVIDSKTERVWRALTEPAELLGWDDDMLAPAQSLPRYPVPGQHALWRYRLGSLQLVMHDRPVEIDPPTRLRSHLNLGSMRLDRTFNLHPVANGQTRLSMRLVTPNSIPLLGDTIDRFKVRSMTTERIDGTLRAIREWCETHH
jgi:uncharacterized protein YndB with AHSA1/START domain